MHISNFDKFHLYDIIYINDDCNLVMIHLQYYLGETFGEKKQILDTVY